MSRIIPSRALLLRRVQDVSRAVEGWRSWLRWTWNRPKEVPPVPRESKQLHIAIVSFHPSLTRESKLGRAIRVGGLRASLIMLARLPEHAEEFDNVFAARNEWDVLRILDELEPDVAHVMCPSGGRMGMLRVLRHTRAKTVFDAYDCTEGMIKPEYVRNPRRSYAIERRCFQTADHICARSLEPLFLRRELCYEMPRATYFPEYCWKLPRLRGNRTISDEDELHIVYAGGVWPEDRFDSKLWSYAQYIAIGRGLAEQSIHLHVYPSPRPSVDRDFDDYYSLYINEAKQNRFFHFYRPLPFTELVDRLANYDAGLHVLGPNITDLGRNTEAKLRYSTTNKIFDYVEAGLPIVIHPGFHQHGLTRHYGEAVRVSEIKEVRRELVRVLNAGPRKLTPTVVIDNQAPRLVAMYCSILNATR